MSKATNLAPRPYVPEPTGMVYCPLKWSEIAFMRCGEYQERLNCHCMNAAPPEAIEAAKEEIRKHDKPTSEMGIRAGRSLVLYSVCEICDDEKPETISPICVSCSAYRREKVRGKKLDKV